MSWVRLDDGFADHPKVVGIGPAALAVHVWGLCYCARHLTDGFVPIDSLAGCSLVTTKAERERAVERLIRAKLWKRSRGGFRIHDYLEFNPAAEKVMKERADS